MAPTKPRLYFAYGSNLSLIQMSSRCPTSTYHSSGILPNYRWIIGSRGYANVVPSPSSSDIVYGMLYTLSPLDEANLDRAESVPMAYTKQEHRITLISRADGRAVQEGGEVVSALVYVDEKRLSEGVCREEYVARMNRGIRDAIKRGMDEEWVERVVRRFVRDEEPPGEVEDPFDSRKEGGV